MNLTPQLTEAEVLTVYPPDQFTMIRGYPRKNEHIRQVEDELGGKLVSDKKPDLIQALDTALWRARASLGHYPDYIAMPSEPLKLFVPIPFEIYFFGLTVNSFHKPAWFQINRKVIVPALPWIKDTKSGA